MKGQSLLDVLAEVEAITKIVRYNGDKTLVLFDYQGLQVACGAGCTEKNAVECLRLQRDVIEPMLSLIEEDPEGLGVFYDLEILNKLLTFNGD